MHELNGKTALVTGASRGIGLATARRLAELGCKVMLLARDESALEQELAALNQHQRAAAMACDVSDYVAMETAVSNTISEFGSLDILVNNAGIIEPITHLATSDPQKWARAVEINLLGVYHGMRAVSPHMLKQKSGTIINLSSGAASNALEGWSHYCATKAAVKMLTQSGHKELSAHGIHTIGLSPGTVATDMMSEIKESGINPVSQLDWSSHITPDVVATSIAFLCTPAGHRYSGEDFSIKTDQGKAQVEAVFPGTFVKA